MRLDKFLKLSRLIKRRTVAKDAAEQGRVWINGKEAKPGSTVKIGDEITVRYGGRLVTVRVDDLRESPRKDEASHMYTVLRDEPVSIEQS